MTPLQLRPPTDSREAIARAWFEAGITQGFTGATLQEYVGKKYRQTEKQLRAVEEGLHGKGKEAK